jgi:phosphoribosyl 1,2-cyclic phosphodiesterase
MDKLKFQSFGSGSSGNCYFIGNSQFGILIDAGVGVRTIRKCLKDIGMDIKKIGAVFVTHNHADHVKSVGVLGEKYHIPIYSTALVHQAIENSYIVSNKLQISRKIINKDETINIGDFSVTAFPVSHDAVDSVGYTVHCNGTSIVIATDLGHIDEAVAHKLVTSDYLVLESNYDVKMLDEGNYPAYLKERISSATGHLSNDQAGWFLSANYRKHWKSIFLCHLSRENNSPELAYKTVLNYLETINIQVGKDIELYTLDRYIPSKLFELESSN